MTTQRPDHSTAAKRVLILGGGGASITTAFELSRENESAIKKGLPPPYDITVLQLGWRIGGKGASGRNRKKGDRVEEHGLHVLMGWYEMTFRMMGEIYSESEAQSLGAGAPFGSFRSALVQAKNWQLADTAQPTSEELWHNYLPSNDAFAGDTHRSGFFVFDYLERLVRTTSGNSDESASHSTFLSRFADALCARPALAQFFEASLYLARAALDRTERELTSRESSPALRRSFYLADLGVALLKGVTASREILRDPEAHLDLTEDFRDFLVRFGLTRRGAEKNPILKNLYCTMGHDYSTMATGPGIYCTFRSLFSWRGCPQWMMRSGMGDIIFAPALKVLRHRGVKFKFFHRVDRLRVDASRREVVAVEGGVQAKTRGGRPYEPLVPVEGKMERAMDCFVTVPDYDQLDLPPELDVGSLDAESTFESFAPVLGESPFRLEKDRDYDVLVCGLAIGAHPHVGKELMASEPLYEAFVRDGARATVRSIGAQVWFNQELAEITDHPDARKKDEGPVYLCGTMKAPFTGYTDVSHMKVSESTPEGSAAAFWGALPTNDWTSVVDGDLRASFQEHLEENMRPFWPNAFDSEGGFRWDLLWSDAEGEERLTDQHIAGRHNPSDLNTLTPGWALSTRIAPDALYDKWGVLVVGDYTLNRACMGLFESAVESGVRAANAIMGRSPHHRLIG